MKCEAGDVAKILFSVNPANIGRIVRVVEYIGEFTEREKFQYNGMPCMAPISDNHWWIEAEDLTIQLGPSPRAYIADTWLEPIKPEKEFTKSKAEIEITV